MAVWGLGVAVLPSGLRPNCRSAAGQISPAVIQMPLGYREVHRALLVAVCVRAMCALPIAAGLGAMTAVNLQQPPATGAGFAVRCLLVVVAAHYWTFLLFAGTSRRIVRFSFPAFVASLALMAVFVASAIAFLLPLGRPWPELSGTAMFAAGWLAARFDERCFNGRSHDLVAEAAERELQTGLKTRFASVTTASPHAPVQHQRRAARRRVREDEVHRSLGGIDE
jgi:hypothetical protein